MVLTGLARPAAPLDPDAPEARRLVTDELAKPEYRAAEPTAFDLAAQAVRDWFADLFTGATGLPGSTLALIAVLVVVGLVLLGLIVFGVPRLRRRAAPGVALFDDGDLRDARTLRRSAEQAASRGDWALAIEERFRALVRDLVERELVRAHPGTTAHGLAAAASARFPNEREALEGAATAFDAVRYLDRPGDEVAYSAIVRLERAVAATPSADPVAAGVPE
ncbi:DUF4129 domain-containing protein [Agromyces marinus]|uniref:Protein-glutamine gamma-glutamyltransferase-like C-terminal domain-containing protein n=1 Tax=Agromyces marinus TaxID=1389020 RepID=A0ABM8GZ24_9MICO|nr:DUF4129 domain-containing protein [Agromyces marinus]UIP58074.1 hypothetical protein DSM26151_09440 [Agromyces marinus]BDZ53702.1 hypothetical protein GCM10025870_07750 [Agromyces marinus]